MMINRVLICLFCALFVACESKTTNEQSEIFLNNEKISDSLVLIIFGSNSCASCERLLNLIDKNSEIREILIDSYKPYYINLSYNKEHEIFLNGELEARNTRDLKEFFNIIGTPTMIFLYDGKLLFSYPGFLGKKRLIATLNFLKNSEVWEKDSKEITELMLNFYHENNI